MKNKPLQAKLLHHVKLMQPDMNKNVVYEVQKQVSLIRDILEIMLTDPAEGATLQPQKAQQPSRGNNREVALTLTAPNAGPAMDPANSMGDDPQPNDTVQTFMTARGTRVVPPSWSGVPPYTLPPGQAVPVFTRQGAGAPAAPPSGVAGLLGNHGIPTHRPVDNAISQEQASETVGTPGGAAQDVFVTPNSTMAADQPAGAGARNITGDSYPGGRSIESGG